MSPPLSHPKEPSMKHTRMIRESTVRRFYRTPGTVLLSGAGYIAMRKIDVLRRDVDVHL